MRLTVVGLFIGLFAASWVLKSSAQQPVAVQQQQPSPDVPVEQVRKNIQVLKGLPDSQLFDVMNYVGDSLGVHCDYCHVKAPGKNPQTGDDNWQWEKDDKQTKLVARDMMRMVLELNRTKFHREGVVTCYSCHRGNTSVARIVPLPPRDFVLEGTESKPRILPSAKDIISKYLSVVGANQGSLMKAIVMKGVAERSRGQEPIPFEIVFRQPNKFLIKQTTPQGVVVVATNGTAGWRQTMKGVTLLDQKNLQRLNEIAANLMRPIKLQDILGTAPAVRKTKFGDRDAYVISVERDSIESTQLFFDIESGILFRSLVLRNTMLGPIEQQSDYDDYREVEGLKLPFVIRTSEVAAFVTTTRKFGEIRMDATLSDSFFDVPKVKAN